MPKIISVEKPRYLENQIDVFSKNRVGQYSKFLDSNPLYVTYYHINQALSTQDVGTGNIESELGERSPIRFNKITQFPIYNLPELKPDITYDESGYDVELECNDLVLLPNTIKPRNGDYFLLSLPNTKEYLFRINNFKYNTIQSNDFYLIDSDIKRIGTNLEDTFIKSQIVEEYLTIFDNIGTQDRCFVKSNDIDYVNNLANLFYKIRDLYKMAYFNQDVNAFTYNTGILTSCGRSIYRYDPYLEYFITKSDIYYDENEEKSLVLSPASIIEDNFKYVFSKTLYSAVLERSIESLKQYCYYTTEENRKRYSPFNMMRMASDTVRLFCGNKPITGTDINSGWKDLIYCPDTVPVDTFTEDDEYFSSNFIGQIIGGTIDTDNYLEVIIFNYINRITFTIDRKLILNELDTFTEKTFLLIPIIAYIINKLYDEYFALDNDLEYLT